MALRVCLLPVLLSVGAAQFGQEAADVRVRPISKVINLLKDMSSQLGTEQEEDEKVYDQFACWCETNDKEKSKAIADAEQHSAELGSLIEELTAKSAQLNMDIKMVQETIAKNDKALDAATAVRDKELAEFREDEKNAITTVKGLEGAVVTLSKHNAGAALSQETLLEIQSLSRRLSHVQLRHLGLASHRRGLAVSLLQQPAGYQSYSSQSGEIFGVLKQMKEDFETNLKNSRAEEDENSKAYSQLKEAKEAELAADQKQDAMKTVELAQADETLVNSQVDLKDTSNQMELDRAFLADLKSRCATMDSEWAARQRMRQDETQAVSEALAILTADDARDLASKSTFIQTSSNSKRMKADRRAAMQALLKASKMSGRPELALLASAMRNDVFAKVIESVDKMIVQLNQEEQDEIKHRDWCIEEYHQNDLQNDKAYHAKANQETKRADLEALIQTRTSEITAENAEIASTQVEMKRASENREEQSNGFQTTISDQRATQLLLLKALDKLKGFYGRKSLLQVQEGQVPPAGFKTYQKQGGSGGVMGMIQGIVNESRDMERETISDDQDSQMAYEEFMKDANKSIFALQKSVAHKSEEKAQADADLARTKADLQQTLRDLDALNQYKNGLDGNCNFVMQNFESRKSARTTEIAGLNEAKALMSGGTGL